MNGLEIIGGGGNVLLTSLAKALCLRAKVSGSVLDGRYGNYLLQFAVSASDRMFAIKSNGMAGIAGRSGNTVFILSTDSAAELYCFGLYSGTPTGYGLALYDGGGMPTYATDKLPLLVSDLIRHAGQESISAVVPAAVALVANSARLKVQEFAYAYQLPSYECHIETQCGMETTCGYETQCGYENVFSCNTVCSWDFSSQTLMCNLVCGFTPVYTCRQVFVCTSTWVCRPVQVCGYIYYWINAYGNSYYRELYGVSGQNITSAYYQVGERVFESPVTGASQIAGVGGYAFGILPSAFMRTGVYGVATNNVAIVNRSSYG